MPAGITQTALDRAEWTVKNFRDFLQGQALVKDQLEHGAVFGG
jgi:hypothetical protein